MVAGVSRSNACKTCKQRRKGCDYRRPSCLRCIRAGIRCAGYEDRRFHIVVYAAAASHSARQSTHFADAASLTPSFSALPPALLNPALRCAYFGPALRILHPIEGDPFTHAWLPDLSGVQQADSALHFAFTAVSLASVGQEARDVTLVRKSQMAYSKAIAALRRQLPVQSQAPSEELIASVITLAIYEVIRGTSEARMAPIAFHTDAARKLLTIRGPRESPRDLAILRCQRQQVFLEALAVRQPSFLARRRWIEVVPSSSPKDTLLNIVAEVPSVMQKLDRLKRLPQMLVTAADVDSIRAEYVGMLDRLLEWRAVNLPSTTFHYETSTLAANPRTDISPGLCVRRRQYSSLLHADLEMIQATVQLLIHLDILDLATTFASVLDGKEEEGQAAQPWTGLVPDEPTNPTPQIDPVDTLQQALHHVTAILESLEYSLGPDTGILAASSVAGHMMISVAFLQKIGDPRATFALAAARDYQNRTGMRLGDFVMEGLGLAEEHDGHSMWWKDSRVPPVDD